MSTPNSHRPMWKSTLFLLILCLIHNSTPNPVTESPTPEHARDPRKIESHPVKLDTDIIIHPPDKGGSDVEPFEVEHNPTERGAEVSLELEGQEVTSDNLPPPDSLQITINHDPSPVASFTWNPPQTKDLSPPPTGYKVTLEQYPIVGDGVVNAAWDSTHSFEEDSPLFSRSFLLDPTLTHFTTSPKIYPLAPGRSYGVRVEALFSTRKSPPATGNFTIRPSPPDRFVVWYRNETCFLILWQPPATGFFTRYKAELSPGQSPALFVTPWEYQLGGVRPGFCGLTPGKAYNISVATVAERQGLDEGQGETEGVESVHLIREYRTMPLPVSGVKVTVLHFRESASTNILVEWEPPSLELGDYDGFSIYIKRSDWEKPVQKFVPRSKPPRAHLDPSGLLPSSTYDVVIKTVSGKVSSIPISKTFTYSLPEQDSQNLHPEDLH